MSRMVYRRQATIVLSPIGFVDEYPERVLTLTSNSPLVKIGRSSKNTAKNLNSGPENAYFDNPVMSREHAKLWIENSLLCVIYLEDLGSMHGTSMDYNPLIKRRPYALVHGAVLTFGCRVTRGPESFPARSFRVRCMWKDWEPPATTSLGRTLSQNLPLATFNKPSTTSSLGRPLSGNLSLTASNKPPTTPSLGKTVSENLSVSTSNGPPTPKPASSRTVFCVPEALSDDDMQEDNLGDGGSQPIHSVADNLFVPEEKRISPRPCIQRTGSVELVSVKEIKGVSYVGLDQDASAEVVCSAVASRAIEVPESDTSSSQENDSDLEICEVSEVCINKNLEAGSLGNFRPTKTAPQEIQVQDNEVHNQMQEFPTGQESDDRRSSNLDGSKENPLIIDERVEMRKDDLHNHDDDKPEKHPALSLSHVLISHDQSQTSLKTASPQSDPAGKDNEYPEITLVAASPKIPSAEHGVSLDREVSLASLSPSHPAPPKGDREDGHFNGSSGGNDRDGSAANSANGSDGHGPQQTIKQILSEIKQQRNNFILLSADLGSCRIHTPAANSANTSDGSGPQQTPESTLSELKQQINKNLALLSAKISSHRIPTPAANSATSLDGHDPQQIIAPSFSQCKQRTSDLALSSAKLASSRDHLKDSLATMTPLLGRDAISAIQEPVGAANHDPLAVTPPRNFRYYSPLGSKQSRVSDIAQALCPPAEVTSTSTAKGNGVTFDSVATKSEDSMVGPAVNKQDIQALERGVMQKEQSDVFGCFDQNDLGLDLETKFYTLMHRPLRRPTEQQMDFTVSSLPSGYDTTALPKIPSTPHSTHVSQLEHHPVHNVGSYAGATYRASLDDSSVVDAEECKPSPEPRILEPGQLSSTAPVTGILKRKATDEGPVLFDGEHRSSTDGAYLGSSYEQPCTNLPGPAPLIPTPQQLHPPETKQRGKGRNGQVLASGPPPRKRVRTSEYSTGWVATVKSTAKMVAGAAAAGFSVFAYLAVSNPDPI